MPVKRRVSGSAKLPDMPLQAPLAARRTKSGTIAPAVSRSVNSTRPAGSWQYLVELYSVAVHKGEFVTRRWRKSSPQVGDGCYNRGCSARSAQLPSIPGWLPHFRICGVVNPYAAETWIGYSGQIRDPSLCTNNAADRILIVWSPFETARPGPCTYPRFFANETAASVANNRCATDADDLRAN